VIIHLFFHCSIFTFLSLTHLLELKDYAPVWGRCLHLYLLAPNLLPVVSPALIALVEDLELESEL
jgi:hypothetical protein